MLGKLVLLPDSHLELLTKRASETDKSKVRWTTACPNRDDDPGIAMRNSNDVFIVRVCFAP